MGKARLEAFSDGVVAIIITIMVLELKVPHDTQAAALLHLLPVFLSYTLSFLIVAIFWVNHHHLLHIARQVTGRVLWINIHFLFWLSLVPFTTGYMGENHLAPLAVALYGANVCLCGVAFDLLRRAIGAQNADNPVLVALHRRASRKNFATALLYLLSIPLAFVSVWASIFIFVLIPALYFMPGPTLERLARADQDGAG